ncbi:MAG: Uma2 family endonuclease [Nocardioides sp.]|uniref:Uma2 family endonuclease n=1 Tax=Nocardioides sp. TaxID=35761 RepID=UPI0039E5BE72
MSLGLPAGPGPWTVDDIPDDGHRYELVDGMLIVVPSAEPRHHGVITQLTRLVGGAVGWSRVQGQAGVTFRPGDYREPDLLVLRDGFDVWNTKRVAGSDAVLLVEVVSPSTVRNDKVFKLNQYAAEGIGHYWIVETTPALTLTAYVLPEGAETYVEAGRWVEPATVEIEEPFAFRFDLSDLRGA